MRSAVFRPLSLFLGLRYTRAKRRNHFISFISLSSLLGIALGVMVLITVLSVMNGFDDAIKERVLRMTPQVTVTALVGPLAEWGKLQKRVLELPDVKGIAPFVGGQGMLSRSGQIQPVSVLGIDPSAERAVSDLAEHMREGKLSALKSGKFGIVLGQTLADRLGAELGTEVTLLTPQATVTPLGIMPRFKTFKVVGIFNVGNGFGYDSNLAYIALHDAQVLYSLGDDVSALRIRLADLDDAPVFSAHLMSTLEGRYLVDNWTSTYGSIFDALQLEKKMMFMVLFLIIVVAAFNLVSTLVMVVTDKQSDIAILRTFGATPATILCTFMVQGTLIGLMGTTLGVIGGIVLSQQVTAVEAFIEHLFHVQLLSSSVYYVDYLPSHLVAHDVVLVGSFALLLSFIATLYPAWRASRVQPAEALRYE